MKLIARDRCRLPGASNDGIRRCRISFVGIDGGEYNEVPVISQCLLE